MGVGVGVSIWQDAEKWKVLNTSGGVRHWMPMTNTRRLSSKRRWRIQRRGATSILLLSLLVQMKNARDSFSVTLRPGCARGGRVVGAKVDGFAR